MTIQALKDVMKKHAIMDCELEDVLEFVEDLLFYRRQEIQMREPYAHNTIKRLMTAENEVADLYHYVEEIKEGD